MHWFDPAGRTSIGRAQGAAEPSGCVAIGLKLLHSCPGVWPLHNLDDSIKYAQRWLGKWVWAGNRTLCRVRAPCAEGFMADQSGAAMIEYSILLTIVAGCLLFSVTAIALWSQGKVEALTQAVGISTLATT